MTMEKQPEQGLKFASLWIVDTSLIPHPASARSPSSRFSQSKPEGCTHANRTAYIDGLLVGFDDMFHNSQAKALALAAGLAATGSAVETLKNPGEVVLVNSNPVICDFNQDVLVHIEETDLGTSTLFRTVADRIINDVGKNLPYLFPIGMNP